jgi:hypothetical protein
MRGCHAVLGVIRQQSCRICALAGFTGIARSRIRRALPHDVVLDSPPWALDGDVDETGQLATSALARGLTWRTLLCSTG